MKKTSNNIPDYLLVKYLLGEATEEERGDIDKWVNAREEHKRLFQQFKTIWEKSNALTVSNTVDVEIAWDRFKQRTASAKQSPRIIPFFQSFGYRIRFAAAVLLFLAGAGWLSYFFYWSPSSQMLVIHSGNKVLTDTLSDGSVVTLNKYATLSYPRTFSGGNRSVRLEGEGFFNVTHNKSKPFIIHANDANIKVVGTSFDVNTNAQKTEVIVETGIVEVTKKDKSIRVRPHEKAIVVKDETFPVKQDNTDELYSYYKTHEFVCNSTPLLRLVDVLNQVDNAHIVIANDSAKQLLLTATFKNESLEHVLDVVCETLTLKQQKKGKEIILY